MGRETELRSARGGEGGGGASSSKKPGGTIHFALIRPKFEGTLQREENNGGLCNYRLHSPKFLEMMFLLEVKCYPSFKRSALGRFDYFFLKGRLRGENRAARGTRLRGTSAAVKNPRGRPTHLFGRVGECFLLIKV